MTVQERIREIVDKLFDGNVSAFCRAINVKQPTMNTILGERRSNPSYEVLSNIINAKALNISAEWLITGEGEMLKSKSFDLEEDSLTMRAAEPTVEYNSRISPITQERLFNIIESQQRTIENLSKR